MVIPYAVWLVSGWSDVVVTEFAYTVVLSSVIPCNWITTCLCGYYLLHPIYAPSVSFGGFLISEYNKPDLIDT